MVGVATNATAYLAFVFIVYFLNAPAKVALTIVYVTAAALSYVSNKHWTFGAKTRAMSDAPRFVIVHITAYLLNIAILHLFVGTLEYSPAIVQFFATFAIAVYLFICFRLFVFNR